MAVIDYRDRRDDRTVRRRIAHALSPHAIRRWGAAWIFLFGSIFVLAAPADRVTYASGQPGSHHGWELEIGWARLQARFGWGWPSESYRMLAGGNPGQETQIGHDLFGFLLGFWQTHYGGPHGVSVRWVLFGVPTWFPPAVLALAIAQRAGKKRRDTVQLPNFKDEELGR